MKRRELPRSILTKATFFKCHKFLHLVAYFFATITTSSFEQNTQHYALCYLSITISCFSSLSYIHSKWKCCKIKLHLWCATSNPVENGFQLLNLYSSIDLFKCIMSCEKTRCGNGDSRWEKFLKLATCHAQFIIWTRKDLTWTSSRRASSKFMQKFIQENSLRFVFVFCLGWVFVQKFVWAFG
jgi:hypothetical protein